MYIVVFRCLDPFNSDSNSVPERADEPVVGGARLASAAVTSGTIEYHAEFAELADVDVDSQ